MNNIPGYTEEAVVSSDFTGCQDSSIYDAAAGIGLNDGYFKVAPRYHNKIGDSTRVVDVIHFMAEPAT